MMTCAFKSLWSDQDDDVLLNKKYSKIFKLDFYKMIYKECASGVFLLFFSIYEGAVTILLYSVHAT